MLNLITYDGVQHEKLIKYIWYKDNVLKAIYTSITIQNILPSLLWNVKQL